MKFLFTTQSSNDLGLLTRSLPIAHELKQRGHAVAFCNPATTPRKLIAEAGFDNLLPKHPAYYVNDLFFTSERKLRGLLQLLTSQQIKQDFGGPFRFLRELIRTSPKVSLATSEVWSADHLAALAGMQSENFVRTECAALVQLISADRVDVVVDSLHPVACMAARISRRPLVTLLQADMHPDSKGFIWWREPPPDLPTPTPVLNKILGEHGLGSICKTEELFIGDLTLVLGMPETDPLPLTSKVTYIGALLWQNPDARMPDWFADLDTDRPVIWVYSGNPRYIRTGTAMDSALVIRSSLAALANEDAQVVLTTGHHALPGEFLPLPANFRHVPFVPGLTMAKRSNLMIHHGGYGSCQTGLYTGTPAVILPTYSERESNARRVQAVGAGEFIVPATDASGKKRYIAPDELRAKVRQVLSTPSYTENARRISEKMQTIGGIAWTARRIEEFSQGFPRISTEK